MKPVSAMVLTVVLASCVLMGCSASSGSTAAPESPATSESSAAQQPEETVSAASAESGSADTVDLMGMYTVTDPEGVDYDLRVALYQPVLESDEDYASGMRYNFSVVYGKDGKGVYMYSVSVFDTAEDAQAYLDSAQNGTVEGDVYVNTNDATFFTAMESFIPDVNTWINNMQASGMMELE